jgi:hypothetical protein
MYTITFNGAKWYYNTKEEALKVWQEYEHLRDCMTIEDTDNNEDKKD